MTTSEFWRIIEKSKRGVESPDEQAEKLEGLLVKLPPAEIVSFENIFTRFQIAAYRWDLWGVAYLLCGGCGDDSFDYFRAWLIGRGQKYYEDAMKDPESVARKVTEDDHPEAEFLLYAASKAYEKRTGRPPPYRRIKFPAEPVGKKWTEEELPALFPVAHKKEGICG
jgi:uncharacterized protein DUF4240